MPVYSTTVNARLTWAYVSGCVAISGLIIGSAVAETTSEEANPYSVISDKNVFHLNPPPPATPAEVVKPPDLPKVMLSGFQKVGNSMKVYLALPAKDPKDTAYLALQAGEKERDVEIVKIRADKQEVDIINTGTPMTLSIASNGFALTGGAAVAKAEKGPGPATFGGHRMALPGAPMPSVPAPATPSPSSGGSAIIMGGGGGNGGGTPALGTGIAAGSSSYGGGAIVSGGGLSYSTPTQTAVPNTPGAQIANSLLSGGTPGEYHMPMPENVNPAPPEVQAAELLVHEAAGGPPSPVQVPEK
jgi:hypothetical protein